MSVLADAARRPTISPAPPALAAPELTVVVPSYNERANVASLVASSPRRWKASPGKCIFVDDDSPDGTAAEARRIARHDTRVRCIRRFAGADWPAR